MPEVETEVRRYVEAVVDRVRPVTADEARARARARRRRVPGPRLLMLVAVLTAVFGVAGVLAAINVGDNEEGRVVTTDSPLNLPMSLDGQRDWLIAFYNGDHDAPDDEIRERFTESFLAEVSPEEFRATSEQLRGDSPWTVMREIERREHTVLATQIIGATGEQARLNLATTAEGKIKTALILSAMPCAELLDPAAVQLTPPLSARFKWLMEVVNGRRELSDDEINATLAPAFLAAVPPDRFRRAVEQISSLGPLTLRSYEGPPTSRSLTARVGVQTGEEGRLTLSVEASEPHRITGAQVLTERPCRLPLE